MLKNGFTTLVFLLTCSFVIGQAPLDRTVTAHFNGEKLTECLYFLIDNAGAKISFSNSIIPKDKIIHEQFEGARLGLVLDRLLANTSLGYEVIGSQIIIKRTAPSPVKQIPRHTINGTIRDRESGEMVIGAVLYEVGSRSGTYSNEYGFFSLNVPEGKATVFISNLSYVSDTLVLVVDRDSDLLIELQPAQLAEIVVSTFNDSNLIITQFGEIGFNLPLAQKLSSLGGESDVLRLAYSLPGIQNGTDGFGGVSVRGGDIDQNQFLLDGVPVYNALHGLGLYSIYNTSAIRSATLLKGSFPAQFGGRISSVWDIHIKEGNNKKTQGELEFGSSSLQLSLEGPLVKGKSSYFFSVRRGLFDFVSVPISQRIREKKGTDGYLKYFFYDLNFKSNLKISKKDHLFFSVYRGLDNYFDKYDQYQWFGDVLSALRDEETVVWGNNVLALRWNHAFSNNLFSNTTATFSEYFYRSQDLVDLELSTNSSQVSRDILLTKYSSNVRDLTLKTDFGLSTRRNHQLNFGVQMSAHQYQPGVVLFEEASIIDSVQVDTIGEYLKSRLQSVGLDGYVQHNRKFGEKTQLEVGLRVATFFVTDAVFFSPQPRAHLSFSPTKRITCHVAADRLVQFQHLLSPTTIGLPKDLWVAATTKAPPQQAWLFSIGSKLALTQFLSLDLELYHKPLKNLLYFEGRTLDAINAINWQNHISVGKGYAYGLEALLKLETNKLSGWINYTWAKSQRDFGEAVNDGKPFPHRLDKRHAANLMLLYQIGPKWDFSAAFAVSSGATYSFPSQTYELLQPQGGSPTSINPVIEVINGVNDNRLPLYHRLDLSFGYNFKVRSIRHNLKFGAYNAYFRKNPVYFTIRDNFEDDGKVNRQVVKVTLLPFFPILRYSIAIN